MKDGEQRLLQVVKPNNGYVVYQCLISIEDLDRIISEYGFIEHGTKRTKNRGLQDI